MSNIRIENNLVVGTAGNKYGSKNPVARYLVGQFDKSIAELAASVSSENILEIGCGEGHVTNILLQTTQAKIHATEISASVLDETKASFISDRVSWEVAKLETYRPSSGPDMVVCCEVLEHLEDPLIGLRALYDMNAKWYLMSVPREPIWRVLNVVRGAYLKDFGNSPGHLQHWSKRSFILFVEKYFNVIQIRSPLPWTVLLCKPKR